MNSISNLSIFSWNVRSLGDDTKCSLVKDVIRSAKVDIIYLQENRIIEMIFELSKL
jgi:exonuclease III